MKKKVYIKPVVEVSVMLFEQHLLAGTPAGGHGGAENPGDTPDEPPSAKFHPVGSDVPLSSDGDWGDLWSDDGDKD